MGVVGYSIRSKPKTRFLKVLIPQKAQDLISAL